MAYQVGDRVGDYEVTGILGQGGMGAVYKVRNVLSNRVEAMKVLLPDLTSNPDVADRFLREIQVLAGFDHPNIGSLRTAQHAGNQVLMVMEFIEGLSLDSLMQRGRIPRDYQLSIVSQVLAALEYAHQRGIVHRDIKPANIMVTQSGQVKLMDFGIAKIAADRKLTATGSTLGSVYYMSPEQIQGADHVNARSDIYSVGICLYEMATGKRPFDASSEYSLMSAHLSEAPRPPIQLDASIPDSLNQIILMSLAKDPGQRFQSAAAMLGALNTVRKELGFEVTGTATQLPPAAPLPVSAPRNRRGMYMAVGSLVTVAIVVGALLLAPRYFRTGAAAPEPRAVTSPVQQQQQPVTTSVSPPPTTPAPVPLDPLPTHPVKPRLEAHTAAVPASTPNVTPQQQPAAVTQAPPQAAAPSQPSKAELSEIREQYNGLAIRAGTVKSGLQSLQNQMGNGLSLRADMREAAARMDYLMQEGQTSLRAGDVENARKNLDLADRTIERLEKFLGR